MTKKRLALALALPASLSASLCASLAATLLLLAGCATSTTQYYSLADTASSRTAFRPAGGSPPAIVIELAPIAMPERFARPQMVIRQKGTDDSARVDVLEDSRWASSFEDELRDALSGGVAGRLGAVDATRGAAPGGQPVVRIGVQLLQFDAMQDRSVDASFSWTLRRLEQGAPVSCRIAISEPVAGGIDAVAAGAQRVTAKLSDAITRSVAALQSDGAPACGATQQP